MELSDEQKKRILEEEQARLAEEQYRAQVRRELRQQTKTVAPVPAMYNKLVLVLGRSRTGSCLVHRGSRIRPSPLQ